MAKNKKEVVVTPEIIPDATKAPEETPEVEEIAEDADEVSVEAAIAALEAAKEQVVGVLGSDAEHLFQPIEDALSFTEKVINGVDDAVLSEAEKEAEILAKQEAANKLLEALYGK